MAKGHQAPPLRSAARAKAAGRKATPEIIHTSVYLPGPVHEALRRVAFDERCKIHDLVIEGIGMALRKRGYPPLEQLVEKAR